MTPNGTLQVVAYLAVLLAVVKPLGSYMARVYEGRPIGLDRVLGWLERLAYRLSGLRPDEEMGWKTYAGAMLLFNFMGMVLLYVLQRCQGLLPLNPQGFVAISPDLAFNNAAGFLTTTDWQSYAGETTMSYLSQTLGLAVQNFLAAATGMSVRPASSSTFSAFVVVFSSVWLPPTVVIPRTSTSGEASASRIAIASSWPGSQSMRIGIAIAGSSPPRRSVRRRACARRARRRKTSRRSRPRSGTARETPRRAGRGRA